VRHTTMVHKLKKGMPNEYEEDDGDDDGEDSMARKINCVGIVFHGFALVIVTLAYFLAAGSFYYNDNLL
ncbi:hypothetical protein SK128_006583, partial [Halocaridina rubra]